MTKKLFLILGAVAVLAGIGYFLFAPNTDQLFKDCAFCDPKVLEKQKFYEDDLVIALYTYRPLMPGHSLIIPKRHVERFEQLTDDEACQICRVIKKVNLAAMKAFGTSSYLILQKNGWESGQSVPHVHFHYIPRKAGDGFSVFFLLKMYVVNLGSPIDPSEMQDAVQKMREAMAQL